MCQPKEIISLRILIILSCLITIISGLPQETIDTTTIKPGRYIPELYGAHLGKYIPDDSGKYYHIHRPYDGGYGDTGIKYVHDYRGNLVPLSTKNLGPKDHLRFMLDFNFDNSGWQIVNFEWIRDDDENYNYKYFNENELFTGNNAYDEMEQESSAGANGEGVPNSNESGVHIEGEYSDKNGYNYSYNNKNGANKDSKNLQQAIREVIYYIENNILPTL